jgi:hypothetical protein
MFGAVVPYFLHLMALILLSSGQVERRPAEHRALSKPGIFDNPDILRVRPLGRVDDVLPDALAGRIDDKLVVRK